MTRTIFVILRDASTHKNRHQTILPRKRKQGCPMATYKFDPIRGREAVIKL